MERFLLLEFDMLWGARHVICCRNDKEFFGLSKDLDLMLLNEQCVVPWAPWILAVGPSLVVVFFLFWAGLSKVLLFALNNN
jgi:hypothetical protein